MVGSIWLEEIDLALTIAIEEAVILTRSGVASTLTVIPRYPDPDLVDRSLPCASLFNYDQKANNVFNKGKVAIDKDALTNKMIIGDTPNRYYLYYQIDFWSAYQKDINEITAKWLTKTDNFGTLAVVDSLKVNRETTISLVNYRNLDSGNKNDRLFRRTYSYKIGAELWEENTVLVPIANQLTINNKEVK